MKTLFNI